MSAQQEFDWSRLEEGWEHTRSTIPGHLGGFIEQRGNVYRYWVDTGEVSTPDEFAAEARPDRSLAFHHCALLQVDACRCDWIAEVRAAAKRLGCVVVEEVDTIEIRPARKGLLSIRCESEEGRKVASWVVESRDGATVRYVNATVAVLSTVQAELLRLGWRFE